jgi:hydrogenase expression/formation protein HypE
VKPAQTLAGIASSGRSASYGNCAEKATSAYALKGIEAVKSMRAKRIRGVLFDFDGTLTLPGALDFLSIRKEISCPLEVPVLEFIEGQPAERRTPLLEVLSLREAIAAEQSQPNEGAETCLSELKRRGILLGIHTRNSLLSVQRALGKFRTVLAEDFRAIMTRDDSLPKPHADGVLKASTKMGVSVEELMVVGDYRFDIIAGSSAGACTVLLTNGKKPALLLEDPAPDHVVDRLEEILDLL